MNNPLYTPIDYISGVGPARAEILRNELKISQLRNLLYHFPFRYVDKTQFHRIAEINSTSTDLQIIGRLQNLKELGEGGKKRLSAELIDATGRVDLVWFKTSDWQKNKIKELLNQHVILFGKPQLFNQKISFTHPELKPFNPKEKLEGILEPVYPSTEKIQKKGISTRVWQKIMTEALNLARGYIRENLSHPILKNYNLIKRETAFEWIHFPPDIHSLEQARRRLKFEEFFFLHLSLLVQKIIGKRNYRSHAFLEIGDYFNTFYHKHLDFELTSAQKRVIKEIRSDLGKEQQMNRLLQGDVGSGKTIVAFLCMLMAADNGFQSLLMAPTEILAQQHFDGLKNQADKIGLNIALLTGSTSKKERKIIHENLENGELSILVGTHALIEEKVKFKNLGLAIVDEQHRFGVAQRAKLWRKGKKPPHILIMTATPIPRTLAMTLYGDLDVSTIDELPAGRKPIKTVHRKDQDRLAVFNFIASEISKGRQAYIVYPLIQESDKMDYKDLMDGFESVSRYFPLPKYAVSIVHGQMHPDAKEHEMQRFVNGETDIMVATTVIEVGVNVPNASIMVIESAEKFGLSQLHQLRGRVGRGSEQSYCILMTKDQLNETAFRRISTMCETNDGFRISEVDLELRGPGNVMGTQQSGLLELKIADLNQDKEIFLAARLAAEKVFDSDPLLQNNENQNIKYFFEKYHLKKIGWANIG
ncbi:ATP-dependent DNA helicase recG [Candidatus Ornithobacterium hominis]|uniref:ATP-dependent DNA helicase RecG n=1 Tax=Candidatus Ornithobacterium hominis TaxID=2497989 RepID=A0A383U4L9_9FLAO|nr:ATP-dependent DNA helicase RecG [Candidatus Ornithobacterium hominis]MCT7905062.1 ATP-dependent DNA helicase RecG [Candidatus Ornithobacterium hominis]SZD74101.1 ATP-dependent DNA helicase recG [Candidatus Ornithobacterium hominis]